MIVDSTTCCLWLTYCISSKVSCDTEWPNLCKSPFFQLVSFSLIPSVSLCLSSSTVTSLSTSHFQWVSLARAMKLLSLLCMVSQDGGQTVIVKPVKRIWPVGGGRQELAATTPCARSQAVPMPCLPRHGPWAIPREEYHAKVTVTGIRLLCDYQVQKNITIYQFLLTFLSQNNSVQACWGCYLACLKELRNTAVNCLFKVQHNACGFLISVGVVRWINKWNNSLYTLVGS